MKRRFSSLWLALGGTVIALFLAAVITFGSLRTPIEPRNWNQVIILYALTTFIVVALMIFVLVLSRTLLQLWAERHSGQFGSRFRIKMVAGAMAISLLPLIFLFAVSYALMNRSLNRWFPRPLELATTATQALLDDVTSTNYEHLLTLGQQAVATVSSQSASVSNSSLAAAALRAADLGAEAAWTIDGKNAVLPLLYTRGESPVPDPNLHLARRLHDNDTTNKKDEEIWQSRSGYLLAARVPFQGGYLFVGQRLPAEFISRYRYIEDQTAAYQAQYPDIRIFKSQIQLTLSLFTVLLLFSATWSAVQLSKQVTVPIEALAAATHEIAAGRFDTRVQVRARDELGVLVRSFNQMTAQLADSRRQIDEFTRNLQQAVQELDRRRALMETVLENIPTGVLSLDAAGSILRINTAARQIFGDSAQEGHALTGVAGGGLAHDLQYLIRRSQRMGTASRELTFRLARRLVHAAVTISALGPRSAPAGFVVVVNDLTDLLQAQKSAAWQEVAQRIAHEIKNPLTPIQLSAERLTRYLDRRKGSVDGTELANLVNECATLIGREVGTLEALVNEFSQFARFPVARFSAADTNAIVRSALEVFDGRLEGVAIHTDLAPDLPPIKADAELLRRVIVNLIDNAAESMEGSAAKHLFLATRFRAGRETVEISVADSGHGISPEDKDKLFLPHFSTKDRGTGLGLAIASRVIAEHHGLIHAEDNSPAGARFVIELPVTEAVTAALVTES